MSTFGTRTRQVQSALSLPAVVDRSYLAWLLIAAMPILILVASPTRYTISIAMAFGYLLVAVIVRRPTRADGWMLAYTGVIAAFTLLSLARAEFIDPLNNAQRTYAEQKSIYFAAGVLPFAIGLGLLMPNPKALKPAALVQLALGIGVAIVSVALQSDAVLGVERYQWQGNVIALAMIVAVQFWLFNRAWVVAVIGALCVAGIMYAGARESVAIVVVGMVLSAVYWAAAEHWSAGLAWSKAVLSVRVLMPIGLLAAQGAAILGTWLVYGSPQHVSGGVTNPCNCVTARIINAAQGSTGGRFDLLRAGASLFAHHPIFGAGFGSFVGLVPGYQYPHNIFLEIGADLGIIGLLLIFVPLAWGSLRLAWQGIRTADSTTAVLLGILAAYLVAANFSGDLPSNRGLWIFAIVAMKFGLDGWRLHYRRLVPAGRSH